MYAPLALTFVLSKRLFIRCLTRYLLRAPVVQIMVNATTTTTTTSKATTTSSSKATSHTGAYAGGIAGGVAALILVIGTIAFVRRRRRQVRFHESAGSSFSGAGVEESPQMTVTPFNLTLAGAAPLEAESRMDWQQQQSGPVGTAGDGPSSAFELPLPPSQSAALVPVGLTSKELARLRSAATRSPLAHPRPSSSGSSTTEQSMATPPPDTRRLQTEMETLRREMQELRAERFEAPPSYGTGGGL